MKKKLIIRKRYCMLCKKTIWFCFAWVELLEWHVPIQSPHYMMLPAGYKNVSKEEVICLSCAKSEESANSFFSKEESRRVSENTYSD